MLVVLDTADLARSCLLDTSILCKASDALEKLYEDAHAKSLGCLSDRGLTAMLVLTSASKPELVTVALDASLESILPPQPNDHHPPSGAAKARHANNENTRVKKEPAQGDGASTVTENSDALEVDWLRAYESLFRMIAGKKHGISRYDLSAALPHIVGIIEIAQKYNTIDVVQSTFVCLLMGYVEHHTLYSTIAKWPAECLNIGVALKSRLVYDEAFKHLVGSGANFKEAKPVPGLSDEVQAIVHRRSRELYLARRDVDEKLMLIALPARRGKSSRAQSPPEYPSQYVSQHDQHMCYNTVNVFRDWIIEHIGHLRNETEQEPEPFYLCGHDDGCTDVAGFYHTIVDRNYLDEDEVYGNFNSPYKCTRPDRRPAEQEMVREALRLLKDKAHAEVAELGESTLHLADKSELCYLTCVMVEPEDVPWDTDMDTDSDEDMDEDRKVFWGRGKPRSLKGSQRDYTVRAASIIAYSLEVVVSCAPTHKRRGSHSLPALHVSIIVQQQLLRAAGSGKSMTMAFLIGITFPFLATMLTCAFFSTSLSPSIRRVVARSPSQTSRLRASCIHVHAV